MNDSHAYSSGTKTDVKKIWNSCALTFFTEWTFSSGPTKPLPDWLFYCVKESFVHLSQIRVSESSR